jgi:2-oxoisovalerate dehydrogenase E1 component alpha subunit
VSIPVAETKAAPAAESARSSSPEPDFVQLLTPAGERVDHRDYPVTFSDTQYRDLYRDLVLVRRLDTEATALQRQGELALWASLLGQEAAQIGSGRAMLERDFAFPTYREHGVAWCRGVQPAEMLSLFRGVTHGGWDPNRYRFGLYTIVIGAQALHATGYAMGVQRDGAVGEDGEAVLCFFGDGASSEGDVSEAFGWAGVYNAPVVFFCQNNQWAISQPVEHQMRVPIHQRAAGFGFPGVRVDGNDVLACYAVTKKAMDDARTGQGPTLIEAYTYRMGAHTTSDDPSRYRLDDEVESWRRRDPLDRVRLFLERNQLADADFFAQLAADADDLAARIRADVLSLPDPEPLAMFDHVYQDGSVLVDTERAGFSEYLAGFEDAGDPSHAEGVVS